MKFRKRPIQVEAIKFDGTYNCYINELEPWVGHSNLGPFIFDSFEIKTLEGTIKCSPGDWIIQGIVGEFYPCKSNVFEATYEEDDK